MYCPTSAAALALQTKVVAQVCASRSGPASANRRLVEVRDVFLVKPVVADVGSVKCQVVGDGALDVQTPLRCARLRQVSVHRADGAL